jgi:hypothetical protein
VVDGTSGERVTIYARTTLTGNESATALSGHVDESDADPLTAIDLGTVVRLATELYNESGHTALESRLYFDVEKGKYRPHFADGVRIAKSARENAERGRTPG